MNTIYKYISLLSVLLLSISAIAQRQDSTLSRQVLLERDYNPTLNEATKINTAPNIFTPRVQSASGVKFLSDAPGLNIPASKLGEVASGEIMTDIPFRKERVYLSLGAGTHGNIDGALGVRALDSKSDKLDIFARYTATSGNIDYAHSKNLLKKAKAKSADLKANLRYQHNFKPSTLVVGGSYQNMGYNYYGNPIGIESTQPETILQFLDFKTKQKVDIINVHAGLKSRDDNEDLLHYDINVAYTNFTSKYGFLPSIDKGPRGGILEADFNVSAAFNIGSIGLRGSVLNQAFSSKENYDSGFRPIFITEESFGFRGLTNLTANPYYAIEALNWDLTVGADLTYVRDAANQFVVAPNIFGQIHINDVNTIYASATGGVNNNTFVDIIGENKYVSPISRVKYSKTIFDIAGGYRSGIIPNLEFDIFAGYKRVKNEHLFTSLHLINLHKSTTSWSNLSEPVYAKLSTGHFGGLLKTKLIPMTTLTAKAVGYFYNVKDVEKAWGKPSYTVEFSADVKPFDQLTISVNYLLLGGRKGYALGVIRSEAYGPEIVSVGFNSAKMKDVNELNIRAEYEVVKWFSVYARANNLLNQKYEQQMGYTLQGLNVLGGVSFQF